MQLLCRIKEDLLLSATYLNMELFWFRHGQIETYYQRKKSIKTCLLLWQKRCFMKLEVQDGSVD